MLRVDVLEAGRTVHYVCDSIVPSFRLELGSGEKVPCIKIFWGDSYYSNHSMRFDSDTVMLITSDIIDALIYKNYDIKGGYRNVKS